MWKSFSAIVAAALVAGAFAGFPRVVEPVSATPVAAAPTVPVAKPVAATSTAGVKQTSAPACAQLAWPYNQCGASKVRVVTTDRLK